MGWAAFVAISVLVPGRSFAVQTAAAQAAADSLGRRSASAPLGQGVLLDRLVAVVNGEVILESDVDEERRFEEFQPYRTIAESTRDKIIERLVDRTLILQQAALEPEDVDNGQRPRCTAGDAAEGHTGVQAVPLRDRRGMEEISERPRLYRGRSSERGGDSGCSY